MGLDYQAISMGMQGISTVAGAWNQYQQGRAREKQYEYQARMADVEAERIEHQGDWQEKRLREQGAQLKGRQRAAYAAGNVQVDTGSPLDIIESTDDQVEMDAAMIRYNATAEANARRSQAGLYRAAGSNARSSSLLAGGATLLTGGGKLFRMYYDRFYEEDRVVSRKQG